MNKSDLRKLYKQKRKNLSSDQIIDFQNKIYKNFKGLNLDGKNSFFIFLGSPKLNEPDTLPIIYDLLNQSKKVYVPYIQGDNMQAVEFNKNTSLTKDKFGILTPENPKLNTQPTLDIVLMPLLISDEKGNRIGFGGGYYDRFLENHDSSLIKIGINFFPPITEIQNTESHDIALDFLISPEGIFKSQY